MRNTRAEGYLWAALTVSIFAGWFVVTRFAVTHTLRAWDVAALRFGVGLVCLAPALIRGPRLPQRAFRNAALFAALWGAPFVLLLGFGLQRTSAAEAAAITPTLTPVFAGLFGWALLRRVPGRARVIGFAAIVLGVFGLIGVTAMRLGPPDQLGLLVLIAASAMWAIYTLLFPGSGLTPVQSAGLICFWSSVVYLPIYLALGLSRLPLASWQELLSQGIYQGVLMSAVGIVTFNRAVVLLGPVGASAIIALLPVMAALIGVPVLGEVPAPLDIAAIAVIALGVLLAARSPARA